MRCSSNNHFGDQCERYKYWGGPQCKYCGYLQNNKLCPRFTKDKKSDNQNRGSNKKVNTTELQGPEQSQLSGYIPAVAQPKNNEQ